MRYLMDSGSSSEGVDGWDGAAAAVSGLDPRLDVLGVRKISTNVLLRLRTRLRTPVEGVPSSESSVGKLEDDELVSRSGRTSASERPLSLKVFLCGISGSFRRLFGFKEATSTPRRRESATIAESGEDNVDVNGPGMRSTIEWWRANRNVPSGVDGVVRWSVSRDVELGGVCGLG